MSLLVQLPKFEGPLALLLYLIRKEEMDIMDINIHEITGQYLEYVRQMRELDLEMAGEFVAMAATLIQIKSRMLLPQYNEQGEIVESEDPRKELVQRLLEYQKFQEGARLLNERAWVGRDLLLRGLREDLQTAPEEIELEENALFSLITSYRNVLKTAKKKVHEVGLKLQSIASRILEMRDRLIPGHSIGISELYKATDIRSRQILITFLSVLELAKMGYVFLFQTEVYSEIWIETKRAITHDVIGKVEEYDAAAASITAESLMAVPEETGAAAELATLSRKEGVAPDVELDSEALSLSDLDLLKASDETIADAFDIYRHEDLTDEGNEGGEHSNLAGVSREAGTGIVNHELGDDLLASADFAAEEIASDDEIFQAEVELGLRKPLAASTENEALISETAIAEAPIDETPFNGSVMHEVAAMPEAPTNDFEIAPDFNSDSVSSELVDIPGLEFSFSEDSVGSENHLTTEPNEIASDEDIAFAEASLSLSDLPPDNATSQDSGAEVASELTSIEPTKFAFEGEGTAEAVLKDLGLDLEFVEDAVIDPSDVQGVDEIKVADTPSSEPNLESPQAKDPSADQHADSSSAPEQGPEGDVNV